MNHNHHDHSVHSGHVMPSSSKMSFWQKFKMSMSMTMGMDHTGLAGREMAHLMEIDIRNKFFFSGWIFLYSTFVALKNKTLNMAVLIAVGITAAYGFSVLLTLIGSADSYYEA